MSQQQELLTDRLVSVISSIQRERRSGVLIAKRGEGIFLEEGTIVFVNGQITEARVGRLRDSARVRNWLSTWESCRFLFAPASSEAGVHGSQPTLPARGRVTGPPALGPPAHMTNTSSPDSQTSMPSSLNGQEGPQAAGERDGIGIGDLQGDRRAP